MYKERGFNVEKGVKKEWVEMTAWVKSEERIAFRNKYNGCFSRFVRNAISMALKNRAFFEKVFFKEVENEN